MTVSHSIHCIVSEIISPFLNKNVRVGQYMKAFESRNQRLKIGDTHLAETVQRFSECRPAGMSQPHDQASAGLQSPVPGLQSGGAERRRRCHVRSCWSEMGVEEHCPHGETWNIENNIQLNVSMLSIVLEHSHLLQISKIIPTDDSQFSHNSLCHRIFEAIQTVDLG